MDAARLIDEAVSKGKRISSFGVILQSVLSLRLVCNHGIDLLQKEKRQRVEIRLGLNRTPTSRWGNTTFGSSEDLQYHQTNTFQWNMTNTQIRIRRPQLHENQCITMNIGQPDEFYSAQDQPYRGPSSKVQALIRNLQGDSPVGVEKPIKRYCLSIGSR